MQRDDLTGRPRRDRRDGRGSGHVKVTAVRPERQRRGGGKIRPFGDQIYGAGPIRYRDRPGGRQGVRDRGEEGPGGLEAIDFRECGAGQAEQDPEDRILSGRRDVRSDEIKRAEVGRILIARFGLKQHPDADVRRRRSRGVGPDRPVARHGVRPRILRAPRQFIAAPAESPIRRRIGRFVTEFHFTEIDEVETIGIEVGCPWRDEGHGVIVNRRQAAIKVGSVQNFRWYVGFEN